jgi:cytochrome c peroxidase
VIANPNTPTLSDPISLSTISREDTGHSIFHSNAGAFLACASCHAEGGEDARVWPFDIGPRRTPSLRGTLAGTKPYHWSGDLKDLPALFDEVYVRRMSGSPLTADQVDALQKWLTSLPAPPPMPGLDPAAVGRGQTIFGDPNVGCSGCHSGPKFTNNATVDVGTNGAYQVPSLLGVAWRAPYLHTGCAANLRGRFEPACGGGDQHGKTSQLTESQLNDLVAYLSSL